MSVVTLPASPAAQAINALGIDLLRRTPSDANALLSPYSIQSALAMTYAGADGKTREEMARVLHYPANEAWLHQSFFEVRRALRVLVQESAMQSSGDVTPLALTTANRLFGQTGLEFRAPFLRLLETNYSAPFQTLDFANDSSGATKHINDWVEECTRQRIRDLIPDGGLTDLTRLVLVNAIYLKAPWLKPFEEWQTKPRPFHLADGQTVEVPTMMQQDDFRYEKRDHYSVVGLEYIPRALQFLILLPDRPDGLPALQARLNHELLASFARLKHSEIILSLPKFKLEPPVIQLSVELKALGMKTAFDDPLGSANFGRMSPGHLFISEVFHKTFLDLDEKGTEAAAATAVEMSLGIHEPTKPLVVNVDRPFLFAIQDTRTGACLFLGRVTDPR